MRRTLDGLPAVEKKAVLDALHGAAERFSGDIAVLSFINEVLTEGEQITIGRRIAVAQLILSGYTYTEVNERLRISPNTYRNIRKWIAKQIPEYASVINDTAHKSKERAVARRDRKSSYTRAEPFSFDDLKRRYPMHFLLFSLAGELFKKKR